MYTQLIIVWTPHEPHSYRTCSWWCGSAYRHEFFFCFNKEHFSIAIKGKDCYCTSKRNVLPEPCYISAWSAKGAALHSLTPRPHHCRRADIRSMKSAEMLTADPKLSAQMLHQLFCNTTSNVTASTSRQTFPFHFPRLIYFLSKLSSLPTVVKFE